MGFFGFLKKSGSVAPPAKPVMTQPYDAIPPPPQPDFSDNFSFDSMPAEFMHDDIHHDSDLDNMPLPSAMNSLLDSPQIEPAPAAPPFMLDIEPAAMPEPQSPSFEPSPQLDAAPIIQTAPAAMPTTTPPAQQYDIPDFSEEEVRAATQKPAAPAHHVRHESETILPLEVSGDEIYVSAHQYQAVLKTLAAIKAASRKGDAALISLDGSSTAHQQKFSAFADNINAIQSSLMQIDNIMLNQR